MMEELRGVVEAIPQISAAAVLAYVLKLFVDGKIHSNSEVAGLREDKSALLESNLHLSEALKSAHQQLDKAHQLLQEELRR